MEANVKLTLILILILIINIFFGYWRATTRKLSVQWFFAIHLPVPIAIALRLVFFGSSLVLLPFFVVAFAMGQFLGGAIRRLMAKQNDLTIGSFLLSDLFRLLSSNRKLNS